VLLSSSWFLFESFKVPNTKKVLRPGQLLRMIIYISLKLIQNGNSAQLLSILDLHIIYDASDLVSVWGQPLLTNYFKVDFKN